jgi:hypothetical protein
MPAQAEKALASAGQNKNWKMQTMDGGSDKEAANIADQRG